MRDTAMAEQVRSVRRHVEQQAVVVHRQDRGERSAGGHVGVEFEDAVVFLAEPEFPGRTEHPLRHLAADLAALEGDPARQGGAHPGEGVALARRSARRTP
jgi:hypothetical protein